MQHRGASTQSREIFAEGEKLPGNVVRRARGPLAVNGGVTNILAAKAPSGVPTHRSDVIAFKAVEAATDEIPSNWLGGRRQAMTWLGSLALGVAVNDLPAIRRRSTGNLADMNGCSRSDWGRGEGRDPCGNPPSTNKTTLSGTMLTGVAAASRGGGDQDPEVAWIGDDGQGEGDRRLDSTESGLKREDSHHRRSFSDRFPKTDARKSRSEDEVAMEEVAPGEYVAAVDGVAGGARGGERR